MARPSELATAGVTAATIARMKQKGLVVQLGRGLYQLPDASTDTHHSLAEAAKRVPKGDRGLRAQGRCMESDATLYRCDDRQWLALCRQTGERLAHVANVRMRFAILDTGLEP
ncbi:type IV toxin-antitoxin system AbiEi family antitoxin domain-containing protein [Bradyrhizobium sp. 33ap4]|uniref:type IV toxin-antitoxin system AbiEi family antitoxin domain-containing protein n=1 Tax=Bradyrhizobium sp. 33ap4 TaxID=3061630 RepID=UPI003977A279